MTTELCVFHGAERAEEEDPFVCWKYDGSRDCAFVSPADLLAAVRRGVESGTIKGEEKRWCVKHDCEGLGNADRGEVGCTGAGVGRRVDMDCRLVPVLVIPVSDGGSDMSEPVCPKCGHPSNGTPPNICSPLRCDAWVTTAVYDHGEREWVSLDDLNEPVSDGGRTDHERL